MGERAGQHGETRSLRTAFHFLKLAGQPQSAANRGGMLHVAVLDRCLKLYPAPVISYSFLVHQCCLPAFLKTAVSSHYPGSGVRRMTDGCSSIGTDYQWTSGLGTYVIINPTRPRWRVGELAGREFLGLFGSSVPRHQLHKADISGFRLGKYCVKLYTWQI